MKLALLLVGVSLAAAVPAGAVTFFSIGGAPDPGLAPFETALIDFDTPLHGGIVETDSGPVGVYLGSSGNAAAPAGDASHYQAVGGGGAATYDLRGYFAGQARPVHSLSVYVGSVDLYNHIDVLDANLDVLTTIDGAELPGNNGDQGAAVTNRRLYINFDPSEAVGGLRFRSDGVAFEYDAIGASAARFLVPPGTSTPEVLPPVSEVPEPATWASMVVGLAVVGIVSRRRRRVISA